MLHKSAGNTGVYQERERHAICAEHPVKHLFQFPIAPVPRIAGVAWMSCNAADDSQRANDLQESASKGSSEQLVQQLTWLPSETESPGTVAPHWGQSAL